MLRWVSISQAAAFNRNAKMFLASGALPPDTLTRVFALGPTGHCGLRPRTPCRLALKVRFAGRLGGVNLHWYRLTSTLHGDCENFGLGRLYILCVSQKNVRLLIFWMNLSNITNFNNFWYVKSWENLTFYIWRTVVSGTWKYDDPRLKMSHSGCALVWHVQPRVVIFPCPTNDCVSHVLSSDQLQESWITSGLQTKDLGRICCRKIDFWL